MIEIDPRLPFTTGGANGSYRIVKLTLPTKKIIVRRRFQRDRPHFYLVTKVGKCSLTWSHLSQHASLEEAFGTGHIVLDTLHSQVWHIAMSLDGNHSQGFYRRSVIIRI